MFFKLCGHRGSARQIKEYVIDSGQSRNQSTSDTNIYQRHNLTFISILFTNIWQEWHGTIIKQQSLYFL